MKYAPIQVLPDVPAGGVFAGIDWAVADHVACVVDMAGRVVDRFGAAHDKAGIEALITRLRKSGVTEVAIERGDGVLVEALLAAGLTVVVVSSHRVKNLRARYRSGGGKDDRFDAFVLADTLRTDRARLGRWSRTPPRPWRCGRRYGPAGTWSRTGWRRATSCEPTWPWRSPPRSGCSSTWPARSACGSWLASAARTPLPLWMSRQSQAWLKTIPERGKTAPASVLCARLRAAPDGVTGEEGAAHAVITAALAATAGMLAAQIKVLQAGIGIQLTAHHGAHLHLPAPGRQATRRPAAGRDRGLLVRYPGPRPWPPGPGHRLPASPARIPRTPSGRPSTARSATPFPASRTAPAASPWADPSTRSSAAAARATRTRSASWPRLGEPRTFRTADLQ